MCPIRPFTKEILALGLALSLSSCAAHAEDILFDETLEKPCLQNGKNDKDVFEAHSVEHPVYCFSSNRNKPPVLLLHELPGLSGQTLSYAKELSQDFTVYVPLLFGSTNMHSIPRGLAAFWFNGEWRGLESGDSKIVKWLRAVVKEIEGLHKDMPIGVIGNCLTGSLPLALLDNSSIHAVVLAQPTLPLTIFDNSSEVKKSLGISEGEIKNAKNKSSAKIFYLRFEQDSISKPEKREYVWDTFTEKGVFPDRVSVHVIPHNKALPENAHSTLIGEWREKDESGKASRDARDEVRRFLREPAKFKATSERE